jgi:acetyl-CoA acetyltransferase
MTHALVAGVGMTAFSTPKAGVTYVAAGMEAGRMALEDAGLQYDEIEQVYAAYVYGDSTAGQRVVYGFGLSGIPIINCNNNCCSGSTALFLARQAIECGAAECVLALGFEQMNPGEIAEVFADRPSPFDVFKATADTLQGYDPYGVMAAQLFGGAGAEHMRRYGTRRETLAQIAIKARLHAQHNPRAVFRDPVSLSEVLAARMIFDPLTRLQCCPPTTGGAAAVVVSQRFAARRGLSPQVRIRGQAMATDSPASFSEGSMIKLVGAGMSRTAARAAYAAAAVGSEDIDVAELHDCFTANELISYEALDFVPDGEGEKFVVDRENTYGGRVVVNPSGGLLAKGHPLGATGLAQCAELTWQLRGHAGPRQVEGARIALQHNVGLGGACVVTIYDRV